PPGRARGAGRGLTEPRRVIRCRAQTTGSCARARPTGVDRWCRREFQSRSAATSLEERKVLSTVLAESVNGRVAGIVIGGLGVLAVIALLIALMMQGYFASHRA